MWEMSLLHCAYVRKDKNCIYLHFLIFNLSQLKIVQKCLFSLSLSL